MQNFFFALLICSATMSAIALFYMAITPLLAKRYSAKWRYYAWLIIVIGLIIPFRPHFDTAIITVDMPSAAAPIIQTWSGTPDAAPNEDVPHPPVSPSITWERIAAAIWLAGMLGIFTYHAIRHYRFMKMVGRWSKEVTDAGILGILNGLTDQMGISAARLLESSCVPAPMMVGFLTPVILLPKTGFSHDELAFILKHELVHFKRKDLWYKCAVLATTAIHWFNPVIYLMAKEISAQCELSCDEEVLRSEAADTRQQYCETIIGMIRNQYKVKTALSTNFYGGKKGMKKRIFSIIDTSKKKAGIAILCCALILTMGTGIAFAANAEKPNNISTITDKSGVASNNGAIGISTDNSGVMEHKLADGTKRYSIDEGKTWMDEASYRAAYPSLEEWYAGIEWYTYEEYKAWIETQKKALQEMVDTGEQGWNPTDGLFTWSQKMADELISQYEHTLEDIKAGTKVSKSLPNGEDGAISYNPNNISTAREKR